MAKPNKFCQSCGMPMKQDPRGGGTEVDGTKTDLYCSYCYQDGAFAAPEIDSAQKMQALARNILHKNGMGKIASWLMTRNIPNLKRWKG